MDSAVISDVDILLRNLRTKIVAFHVSSLFVFIVLASFFVNHSKTRLAKQFAEAFRDPLISGNNSQVMLGMERPLSEDFTGVVWKSDTGSQDFSIPPDFIKPVYFINNSIAVPIYFDEEQTHEAGRLIFYYTRWLFLGWSMIAWGILVLLSLPLTLHERNRITKEYNLSMDLHAHKLLALFSAQVAHDIRSPLAALDVAVKDTVQMPEKQRVVIRNASNRIRDIANNLIEKYRSPGDVAKQSDLIPSATDGIYLMSALLDPMITEKRLQFHSKPGIQIDLKLTPESYGLFAKLQPVEFRRMVSNLVNNSAEALGNTGAVSVGLSHENGNIILTVADNGKGIPPEILAKLGQKGETHGKAGGSGLGLYHARTTAESWGGSFKISSEVGKGTIITVILPKAPPPDWFVPRLELSAGKPVVVLDDDSTIHQVWKGRFESSRVKEHGVEIFSFSTSEQLRDWVKSNPAKAEGATYLLDYELLGHTETGLAVAEQLNIARQSILVTSRWEEPQILAECNRLKIRLIPKGLSWLVPITVVDGASQKATESKNNVAVLVDDDPLVHMTWEMAAEEKGIHLLVYKNPDDLLTDIAKIDLATPIYIDSKLGGGVKGEDFAQTLHDKGFTNISMETGHKPEKFAHLTFLKNVQSKNPPWQ
jgi:signal transduction histidine kinase